MYWGSSYLSGPQDKKALHQLFGLMIYYQRFVPSCVYIDGLYTRPWLPTVLQEPPAFDEAKSSLLEAVTSVYPHANTGTCITTKASNFAIGPVLDLFTERQGKLISHGTSITTQITSPSKKAYPAHRRGWFMKRHPVRQETSPPPLSSRTLSRLSQDCVVQCNTSMAAMMPASPWTPYCYPRLCAATR